MDAAFRAAEAHGIRAILGKVMMDRVTYDPSIDRSTILERSLRESADLIARWHGRDEGRLGYAVTPRFAVSCTAEMLRESAALARVDGRLVADARVRGPGEIAEVARLFPEALDYVDVYDRAGGLGERTVLAHAVHLSDRELAASWRPARAWPIARPRTCSSASGVMPLARYLEAGLSVGLGSDVAGGPDAVDVLGHARRRLRAERRGAVAGSATRRDARPRGRWIGCGWARSMGPGRSGWTTGSGRSRPARRRT